MARQGAWSKSARQEGRLKAALAVGFVALLLGSLFVARLFFQPVLIASGAMKPALLPGDVVLVRTLGAGPPARGEVVLFEDPALGVEFIFRIVGLPEERIALRGGALVIDGETLPRESLGDHEEIFARQGPSGSLPMCRDNVGFGGRCLKALVAETLPGGRRIETLDTRATRFDDAGDFEVPAEHYFVLGDNRDNAADSRVQPPVGRGFVPADAIRGRATRILFSSEGALWNVARWRPERILEAVR